MPNTLFRRPRRHTTLLQRLYGVILMLKRHGVSTGELIQKIQFALEALDQNGLSSVINLNLCLKMSMQNH